MVTKKQKEQLKILSPEIREIARNLFRIKQTGSAPINLTRYKKMNLVKIERKYGKSGGKKVEKDLKLRLTEKGKKILNSTQLLSKIR